MKWKVVYMARKFGAIGVHYENEVIVEADDERSARDAAFDQLHADGWETTYPKSVEKIDE